MAKTYFDSSVLLAILLGESKAEEAGGFWSENRERVSSVLLEAECLINLRRYSARASGRSTEWMEQGLDSLRKTLEEVVTKEVDAEILEILRREEVLADCRTLDAVHLATALYFREKSGEDIRFASFDQRLRDTAARLKFSVLPA